VIISGKNEVAGPSHFRSGAIKKPEVFFDFWFNVLGRMGAANSSPRKPFICMVEAAGVEPPL